MNIEDFISTIPFSSGCEVLSYDQCGLIAIYKKAGRASHPNKDRNPNAKPSMIHAKYNFEKEYFSWTLEDETKCRLWLINRLDSPTSGVILAATSQEIADAAKLAFKERKVEKIYHAICIAKNPPRFGHWRDIISEKTYGKYVRSSTGHKTSGGAKIAEADFKVEAYDKRNLGVSLVRLTPKTGITHQLRVQCTQHHMPILGDATYGDFLINKKIRSITKINRLFLHCSETSLSINVNGKEIKFSALAPLPESFIKTMNPER